MDFIFTVQRLSRNVHATSVSRKQVKLMFQHTIHLEIEKMDDEFDGDLDQYGLPKENDDEDVLSDDLDLNYEPSQKSKRMQTQKRLAAKKLPTKLDKATPADSQMDVASSQGSMPSKPGTSKKTKVNPKRDDDDDNKKKKVAALKYSNIPRSIKTALGVTFSQIWMNSHSSIASFICICK